MAPNSSVISSCSSSSSSSSDSTLTCRYDVFLCFSGLDTRNSFCDHLYSDLVERGIKVFRDDKTLKKGKVITRTIFRAIYASRFSVVVLSRNFASSEWCLDELVKIMELKSEMGHLTFPVFYHVKPDHAMNQSGCYGKVFLRHESKFDKERVQRWRAALTEISGVCGWDVQNYRSESKLVKLIVNKLSKSLKCSSTNFGAISSGMKAKPMELYCYDSIDSMGIVRICGVDDTSNTTMARIVYDAVVREKWGNDRIQELISEMPEECTRHVWDIDTVINAIRKKMVKKKVLLLVDHIDTLEEVAFLVRKHAHGWVPNSRVVISSTTSSSMILNALDISFRVPDTTELNTCLDIACFVPVMDDSHVTTIVRSLVSTNFSASNRMEFAINKTFIDISDNDKCLLDMGGDDIFFVDRSESSKSNNKTKNKPAQGPGDINRQIKKHFKASHQDSRAVSMSLRYKGKLEGESTTIQEKNAATSDLEQKFISDSRNRIESKFCCVDGIGNSRKINEDKNVLFPNSMANVDDDCTKEGKSVASCSYDGLNDRGSGFQNNIKPVSLRRTTPSNEMLCSSKARDRKLQYFRPEISNGTKIVRIPEAVIAEGIKQWELCLVGQLLGKCLDISLMLNEANKLWGKDGRIEVTITENELYIFKFPNENVRDQVLGSGPWQIANKQLVLRMWQRDMKLSELDNSRIPIWVKLTGIPMQCLTKQGVSYIASALGKPLYTSAASAFWVDNVKVCVEVSLEDEMMDFITVMGCDGDQVRVKVEYLWKPDKCLVTNLGTL